MLLVVVEIEAAVFTRGLVIVTAFTLTIVAGLGRGANLSAFTTICLVGLQIHAYLIADVGAAYTLAFKADLFRPTGLIAVATMRWVGLGVDAGLLAGQQRRVAALHAKALRTKAIARLVTATTVHRVGVRIDASVSADGLTLFAYEAAMARYAGATSGARVVTGATVLLRGVRVDAEIFADRV
jgi:hypothetical protein